MTYRQSYDSPLGKIFLHSDGETLTGVWFDGSRDAKKHAQESEEKPLAVFDETRRWLDIYFGGRQPDFTPAYRPRGLTPFRAEVVEIMLRIPFGTTVTYGDIAREVAKRHGLARMSAQAVGGAVGWNPVCIIIPCHRVVGTNGSLTGYGGGIQNKVALLAHEGNDMSQFFVPTQGTAL